MSPESGPEPTPSQTIGPFFHDALLERDLTQLVSPDHPGAIRISGVVYDGAEEPVTDAMVEISQAGQRQSEGIEDIGRAIDSMDEMTQQNSALVEEASAAAESLTEQTGQLTGALSVFKLAEHADGPALGRPVLALR